MIRIRVEVTLSNEEEKELKQWRRRRNTDGRLQFRAGLILDCSRGFSVKEIAERHRTSEATVSRWRQRFIDHRLDGLTTRQVSPVSERPGSPEGRKGVPGRVAKVGAALVGAGKFAADKAVNVGGELKKAKQAVADKAVTVGVEVTDAGAKKAAAVGAVIVDGSKIGAKNTAGAAILAAGAIQIGFRKTLDTTVPVAEWLSSTAQGLLASGLDRDLNGLLQDMVKGPPTIYDKAMDAIYNETHMGGALHRLFDGGHTLYGAFKEAVGASADDSLLQEALGAILGLARDGTTVNGLPLATWNKDLFDSVAGWLQSSFHIPKSWFYDLMTYDAVELMAASVGVVAVVLAWDTDEVEMFSKLIGGMGIAALLAANPLLLVVTVVSLARAFHKACEKSEYTAFVDGLSKGAFATGATLSAVALVGAAGGPAGMTLLVGLVAGVLASQVTENMSLADVKEFVLKNTDTVVNELNGIATGRREWWPRVTNRGLRFFWRPIG